MSDYDPSELMVVCESIIEDGELTYDELYQLAEWLNNDREACLHWPGNLLVEVTEGLGRRQDNLCLSGCFSKPPHVGVQLSAGSSEWPLRLE
jgi:hypothetical protein